MTDQHVHALAGGWPAVEFKRLIVGIDLDGVLFDFDRGWTQRRRVAARQQVQYDQLHNQGGFDTREEFWEWFNIECRFQLPPDYRLMESLRRLAHDKGWRYRIVTNRPSGYNRRTIRAISNLDERFLRYVVGVDLLGRNRSKAAARADVYVDDAPPVLWDLVEREIPVVRTVRSGQVVLSEEESEVIGHVPCVDLDKDFRDDRDYEQLGRAIEEAIS